MLNYVYVSACAYICRAVASELLQRRRRRRGWRPVELLLQGDCCFPCLRLLSALLQSGCSPCLCWRVCAVIGKAAVSLAGAC